MDCNYPDCLNCKLGDCVMEQKDIRGLLKRREYAANPEVYRKKQREYRNRVKEYLPHCDECEECILVRGNRLGGDCPKTKIEFGQDTICGGEQKQERPDVVCCEEESRVFGQPVGGLQRLCIAEIRLIEQKVSNSPQWCPKRLPVKEREHQRYLKRKEGDSIERGEKTV